MSSLPLIKTEDQSFALLQTRWKAILDAVIGNQFTQGNLIKRIPIQNGVNIINHLLARTQQGWVITDINASVTVFKSAPFNDKTLTLTSNGPCTLSLWVY